MNNNKRKLIKSIIDKISTLKSELNDILMSEEESYENMQNLQNSIKGCESQEAISVLYESIDCLENCCSELESIV